MGFYAAADPNDPYIIYSESQNGAMNRIDMRTGRSVSIRPRTAPRRGGGGGGGGRRGGEEEEEEQPRVPVLKPVRRRILQPHSLNLRRPRALVDLAEQTLQHRTWSPLRPRTDQYRFYWNTPIIMSPHNPSILIRWWRPILQVAKSG
jgi:hypothetical protein